MTRCKINNEEMVIKGIDEIPMFSWNTETKEFYVLGHKFDGANSIEDFVNFINDLQKENEKLNHYKLLYQKVKDRNDKAIVYLEQELEYSKKDCIPSRQFTCEKALKILKGNNEVSNDNN